MLIGNEAFTSQKSIDACCPSTAFFGVSILAFKRIPSNTNKLNVLIANNYIKVFLTLDMNVISITVNTITSNNMSTAVIQSSTSSRDSG